jgi:hypothetical protein
MSKYSRHQSVISRNSDSHIDEDNWLNRFEKSLQKDAVQPKKVDQSIFEQITTIMNGKPKYPSVQAAVDDMKNRSGLTDYLNNISKTSGNEGSSKKKTASDNNGAIDKKVPMAPIVFTKCPRAKETARNYITSTRGNLPVPAIIQKIKSIHDGDVSDASDWEEDNLVRAVSRMNLEEKSKNYADDAQYNNLGKGDDTNDTDIDPSNMDAFHGLNPVKI